MPGGRFGWRQAPLLSHSTCKAEHAGRCRRRGETRLPESDHTTAKVAPIVAGTEKPPWDVCCVGLSQPPQLCHEHLAAMTLHLPPLSSLWDMWICHCSTEMADPGHGPRKARTVGSRSRQGKIQERKRPCAPCRRRLRGVGPSPPFTHLLRVWSSSLLKDGRGRGGGAAPRHPAGTQKHAHPKGSAASWTPPHSRTNNHSSAPPRPTLPPDPPHCNALASAPEGPGRRGGEGEGWP